VAGRKNLTNIVRIIRTSGRKYRRLTITNMLSGTTKCSRPSFQRERVPGTTAAKAEAGTVDCNKLNQPTEFKILDHAAVAVLKNQRFD